MTGVSEEAAHDRSKCLDSPGRIGAQSSHARAHHGARPSIHHRSKCLDSPGRIGVQSCEGVLDRTVDATSRVDQPWLVLRGPLLSSALAGHFVILVLGCRSAHLNPPSRKLHAAMACVACGRKKGAQHA